MADRLKWGGGHLNVDRVLELRRLGLGYRKIAKEVGISRDAVLQTCHRYGLGGFLGGENKLDEKTVADYVDRSGFDYVGGYQMAKKPITVRCRVCGRTFERQFHIFRDVVNGTWMAGNECPLCREDQAKLNKAKSEHEAQERKWAKAERQNRTVSEELTKRLAIHVCKNCGKEFCQMATGYNSLQYCSESCQVRWNGRRQRDKRVKRMMTGDHDSDITLEKLYQRDGGTCYLCGNQCDWNDGVIKDGTFVAGQQYPSIDHVIPLSKGGRHTWENVKLSCRGCNSRKGPRQYAPNIAKK